MANKNSSGFANGIIYQQCRPTFLKTTTVPVLSGFCWSN